MLDPNKIEEKRIYLNITTGEVCTGQQLRFNSANVHLADWVDKEDAGKGRKYDTGKPDWALVPGKELEDVVKVFTMGAEKYGRENWKSVEDGMFRYFSAMMRHINSYKKYLETGDEADLYDAESGLHHLSHAMTNALFLMWLDNNEAHVFTEKNMPSWWDQKQREREFFDDIDAVVKATMEDLNSLQGSEIPVDMPKDQNPYQYVDYRDDKEFVPGEE